MTILHTLLLQATTTVKQRTGQYLPYLVHIDGTATVTPLAHFLKASPFKGFSHTFGSQGMPGIETQIGENLCSGHIGAMGIIISWLLEAAQQ